MVSRAFQILSDPEKKKRYDQFGGDPDNRFSSSGAGAGGAQGASPFSGFARSAAAGGGGGFPFGGAGAGGPMFEEEISPEELFRQFFGGGAFGGGGMGPGLFGNGGLGGSSFVFSGPGGIRVHQFGGNRPRRRPPGTGGQQQEEAPNMSNALLNLLPIILLFVVMPLLSSIFGGGEASFRAPPISLDSSNTARHLTHSRVTRGLEVEYFYNPRDVAKYDSSKWSQLDNYAESNMMQNLKGQCIQEEHNQQRLFTESQGWFSIDREKEEMARNMPKPSCERYVKLDRKRRRSNMWF